MVHYSNICNTCYASTKGLSIYGANTTSTKVAGESLVTDFFWSKQENEQLRFDIKVLIKVHLRVSDNLFITSMW